MEKRTWAYIQSPSIHDVASCSCGNENTQWSEYAEHIWCPKCEKDFIPAHNGIFDGPIAVSTARIMGITFDRFNLLTNKVEIIDDLELQNGFIYYLVCHNIKEVIKNKSLEVDIKHYQWGKEQKVEIKKGLLSLNAGMFHIELFEKVEELNRTNFMLTINFDYPDTKTFNLMLSLNDDFKSFNFINTKEFKDFNQFMMLHELDNDLLINHSKKKIEKI